MKKLSFWKKPAGYLYGFLAAALLCLSGSVTVLASEEVGAGELSAEGILQEGGLLTEEANPSARSLRMVGQSEFERVLEEAVENFQTLIPVRDYQMTIAEMTAVMQTFLNEHPQYFYLKGGWQYKYSGNLVTQITLTYTADAESVKQMRVEYDAKVDAFLSQVDPNWSDLEKAMFANDYLAVNCEYDTSYKNHSAYDALVRGVAVCQGYALAYTELLRQMGVPCEMVTSNQLNHAWNLVKIGDHWYHVDVTWNDPLRDMYNRARHVYLLKSTSWFKSPSGSNVSPHNASDFIYSGSLGEAQASDRTFDSCLWNRVDSPFYYDNGFWYGNQNGTFSKYTANNSGIQKVAEVTRVTERWYVWGSKTQAYSENYSGCSIFDGSLYYATPQQIYSLDLSEDGAEPVVAFELSALEKTQGYIYEFRITRDGKLQYGIAREPDTKTPVYKESSIHTHTFGAWTQSVASTCSAEGEEIRSCQVCSQKQKRTLPRSDHTPGAAATCIKPRTCTVCQAVIEPAIGHTPEANVSCMQPRKCVICGERLSAAAGHTPGAEATCQEPQRCIVCGEILAEKGAHTPGKAATCTTPQECTICHAVLKEAAGHTPQANVPCTQPRKCTVCQTMLAAAAGHTPGAAATCKEPQRCTVCDQILMDIRPHTPGAAATCQEPQRCTVCDAILQEAKPHTPGKEATCAAPQECTVCHTILKEAKPHTPGGAAMCTSPQQCTVCGAVLQEARGHTPNANVSCTEPKICTVCKEIVAAAGSHAPGAAATCREPQRCTVCDTVLQGIQPHTAGAAATCTSPQRCTVCNEILAETIAHTAGAAATCTSPQRCVSCKQILAEAKPHTPGGAATCTSPQRCTVCQSVLASAKGHTAPKAVSCTKDQNCTVCHQLIRKASGHRFTETVEKPATFLKTGSQKVVCKTCGKTLKSKTLNKVKCKKGAVHTVGNYRYKIISAKTNGKGTVSFYGLARHVESVKIGDTVTILGAKFKVIKIEDRALKNSTAVSSVTVGKNVQTIGKEAFYGAKELKTITVKSTKLTKVGANALKKSYGKLKIKVPKSKLKKYQKLWKGKGQKKTVKVY